MDGLNYMFGVRGGRIARAGVWGLWLGGTVTAPAVVPVLAAGVGGIVAVERTLKAAYIGVKWIADFACESKKTVKVTGEFMVAGKKASEDTSKTMVVVREEATKTGVAAREFFKKGGNCCVLVGGFIVTATAVVTIATIGAINTFLQQNDKYC